MRHNERREERCGTSNRGAESQWHAGFWRRSIRCMNTARTYALANGLQQYINASSSVNFSFLMQCSWEASALTFQFALSNGGPASIVYGSIFAWVGTMLVALSLAEISSMDPTVGAQYRWSAAFAPIWNRFFGLMQGWITVFAWICCCTSNAALISNIVTAMASFNNPEYSTRSSGGTRHSSCALRQ